MKKIHSIIIAVGLLAALSLNAQTTPPKPTLPDELKNLVGEAELMADVIATAKSVTISVYSNAQIGDNPPVKATLIGMATNVTIAQAIVDAKATIKVSGPELVGLQVSLADASGRISLIGWDYKTPVAAKGGGYELPKFTLKPQLQSHVLVPVRNIRNVKMTWFDSQGRVAGSRYLDINENGFYFEPRAAGKVMLELTDNNGATAVYDLRKGAVATVITLVATANVEIPNVEFVTDKNEMNLIPYSENGRGKNVLGVLTLAKPTTVSIAGRTTENVNAIGFKYRQVGDANWVTATATPNGLIAVPFPAGKWQVIPLWGAGFSEELYTWNGDGKGN